MKTKILLTGNQDTYVVATAPSGKFAIKFLS